jgi:hypothetical protein
LVQRRRRSGPLITSTLAIALSLAPVQAPVLAPVPTQPDQPIHGKTALGGRLREIGIGEHSIEGWRRRDRLARPTLKTKDNEKPL